MAIEPYQNAHFEGVATLWREAFPDDRPWNAPEVAISAKLQVQRELFLVALVAGAVVGSVMAGYDGHRGWISRIAVRRSHQSEGVGRRLLEEAEARLAALGCVKVNVQVVTSNAAALQFYERVGYAVEERVSLSKTLRDVTTET